MKRLVFLALALCVVASGVGADEVLHSGRWDKGRTAPLRGSWEIIRRDDGVRVLVLGEDFRARNGPDLKIFFSRLPLRRLNDGNAASRSHAVRIAALRSSRGAQEYVLPNFLDLSVYKTWMVHCERYAHFWDGAELTFAEAERPAADAKVEPSPAVPSAAESPPTGSPAAEEEKSRN